jgi:DNA polymerase III epsilon subunit-like protein
MGPTERRAALRRNEAIAWAQHVLANKDQYVIFDTETTGLKESDVIVHFAVMDLDGTMLIDTKVKPTSKRRMSSDAAYLHGLTMKDLKDAPLFEDVVEMLRPIADSRRLLSFNVSFHAEMFQQSYYNEGVSGEPIKLDCYDVKDYYIKFMDQDRISLPGRKNTGQGDCLATLAVLQKMASAEPEYIPEPVREESASYEWAFFLIIGGLIVLMIYVLTK